MSTININKVNNRLRNSIDYTYEAVYNSKNGHGKFKKSRKIKTTIQKYIAHVFKCRQL